MVTPLRFEYIPYPLWRRRFPSPVRAIGQALWPRLYPVAEDQHPPQDAATMADFLVRHRLLPGLELRTIYRALESSQAEIEHTPEAPPVIAPDDPVRLPAQWEPMEAVVVNWPVMYPPLWELHAQMVEAIAPVAQVMVTIPAPMWGHAAWLYLTMRQRLGAHMEQVRFFNLPTNDIWVRDHGPMVGYAPDGGRVALNAIYDHLPKYPQGLDNHMPRRWAAHTGTPLRDVALHTEGGNLWTDGAGTLIMTEQIFNENPTFTLAELEAYLHEVLHYEKLIITPRLHREETGHIDLLMKLADPETILISEPGDDLNREPLQQLTALFRNETNARGQPYKLITLPRPRLYVNWFAYPIHRSYTNALTINGRVLLPVYRIREDEQALRIYQEAMPDHEIIPIDCRVGINGGGAVHCMTKEIPAVL